MACGQNGPVEFFLASGSGNAFTNHGYDDDAWADRIDGQYCVMPVTRGHAVSQPRTPHMGQAWGPTTSLILGTARPRPVSGHAS